MAKVNFKITVGVAQRAEIRDICKGIKANPAHYETIALTNKDASAKLKVRFQSGDSATYAVEVKTVIDCETIAVDWFQSNSFNEIEGFIRGKCSVETLNETYAAHLVNDLDDAEIKEIDAMIEGRKNSVDLSKPNHVSLRKSEQPTAQQRRAIEKMTAKDVLPADPLDIVLMDSLLLVRKGNGILKPGQVLDLRGVFTSKNGANLTVDVNVNNIYNDELQYCGSQFYTLAALSIAIANGDLAIITHSAPLKNLRVYDSRGGFYTTDINPQSRLTTVTTHFIKHGGANKITFHPVKL